MKVKQDSRGFTLVEIAIVLVIIGLLLGAMLKGQELINNAKLRGITKQHNALKVAWFAFIDRYDAMPGDYTKAHINIKGAHAGDGDGNIVFMDAPLVMQNLTAAGFLRCPQCTETASAFPSASNSLINSYGGVISIWQDGEYYAAIVPDSLSNVPARMLLHTGPYIPSNILAELDNKIDDGVPNTGVMNLNEFDPLLNSQGGGIGVGITSQCMKQDVTGTIPGILRHPDKQFWRPASANPSTWLNCGASINIPDF